MALHLRGGGRERERGRDGREGGERERERELLESAVEEFVWALDPVYVRDERNDSNPSYMEGQFIGHSSHDFVNVLVETHLTCKQHYFKYIYIFSPMPPHVLMNVRGFPPGCGDSVADF